MEEYPNFDPIYMKFIEGVTFNQMARLNKNDREITKGTNNDFVKLVGKRLSKW